MENLKNQFSFKYYEIRMNTNLRIAKMKGVREMLLNIHSYIGENLYFGKTSIRKLVKIRIS